MELKGLSCSCHGPLNWRQKLLHLRETGLLCDFVIRVGDREWKVHRLIMVSASE